MLQAGLEALKAFASSPVACCEVVTNQHIRARRKPTGRKTQQLTSGGPPKESRKKPTVRGEGWRVHVEPSSILGLPSFGGVLDSPRNRSQSRLASAQKWCAVMSTAIICLFPFTGKDIASFSGQRIKS